MKKMRAFKLTERDPRTGCRELRIQGDLDLAVTEQLEDALDSATDCQEIWIDLSECDFIDSTALAIFVNTYAQMRETGRRLFLYHPSAQVARVLEVTGLNRDGLVIEQPHS
ncbi:MAG TPA: STAS domain-containing protein [Solirubrobacterales bacterium]|jgi:anti-sigma B factor antagonist|nr:STAS domain-containing protein [Solirubrobacterales bacterium]